MPINNEILAGLTRAAFIFAKEVRNNLRRGKYPDEITKGIKVDSAKASGDGASIEIVFDAPMARAFEIGSGEHGPEREKYEIRPKSGKALAFEWDKTPAGPGEKFIGSLPDGRLMFRFVDHPGIEARPYIEPALIDKNEEMKKAIGASFIAIIGRGQKKRVVLK